MNIDDLLAHLAQPPGDSGDPAIEAGLRRLQERLRQLDENPAESDRIHDAGELVEADDEAYRSAMDALDRHDLETAERSLRRLARHGHGEAAYWLAHILLQRAIPLRFKGSRREANELTAEAVEWLALARNTGAAHALEDPADEAVPVLSAAESTTKSSETGYRDPTLEPVPTHQYAIGVELRPFELRMVLADSAGNIVRTRHRPLTSMEKDHVVDSIAAITQDLAATLERDIPRRDIALGVQLGGPVDSKNGIVLFFSKHPPYLNEHETAGFRWNMFPFGEKLQEATGYATVVENDTNAFAEREQWLGIGQRVRRFVVVLIREGIGGSVVSKGEIFSGPVEIGQFINSIGGLRPSDAGQMGTIEGKAGTVAIIDETAEKTGQRVTDIDEAAALAADPATAHEAQEVFTAAGVAIACTIGYLINFAWPSHVVVYGPPVMLDRREPAARAFMKEAEKFDNFVAFDAHRGCELIPRPLSPFDGAQGAAMLALRRCLDVRPVPPTIRPEPAGRLQ